MDSVDTFYQDLGEERLRGMVGAFYRRVRGDDVLGPLYPLEDLAGAEKRLGDFLIGRFGGPPVYVETRGHPRLRMRHAPFAIGVAERDRWLELMGQAMVESGIPEAARPALTAFFAQVADFMRNREG
ncbi:MAG: globin [Prosthecobacter sp.]|nr:globin [Prosthecobacter sp.]